MKTIITLAALLVMTNAFATVEKAERLRLDVQAATNNAKSLVQECSNIDADIIAKDKFLANLNDEISKLSKSENRFLNEAKGEIVNARSILYMAKEDCINGGQLTRGQILLEMYLVHIDTDLMIYSNIN